MSQPPPALEDTRGEQVWRLGQGVMAVFGAFLVAIAITPTLTGVVVDAGFVAPNSPEQTVVRTVFQFLGFAVAVAGFLHLTEDWGLLRFERIGFRHAGLVAAGTVGLIALQFAILYAFSLVGITTGENQAMLPGREEPTYFLYMVVVSVALVGPAEELLFRGVVQGLLRRAWSAWPAILLASAMFGAVHVVAVVGTPEEALLYSVVAGVLGCVLGYLYERTANVLVPALVHGLYNASLFGIQFLDYALG